MNPGVSAVYLCCCRGCASLTSLSSIFPVGMVTKPSSEQSQDFSIHNEDFPALPGPNYQTKDPTSTNEDSKTVSLLLFHVSVLCPVVSSLFLFCFALFCPIFQSFMFLIMVSCPCSRRALMSWLVPSLRTSFSLRFCPIRIWTHQESPPLIQMVQSSPATRAPHRATTTSRRKGFRCFLTVRRAHMSPSILTEFITNPWNRFYSRPHALSPSPRAGDQHPGRHGNGPVWDDRLADVHPGGRDGPRHGPPGTGLRPHHARPQPQLTWVRHTRTHTHTHTQNLFSDCFHNSSVTKAHLYTASFCSHWSVTSSR